MIGDAIAIVVVVVDVVVVTTPYRVRGCRNGAEGVPVPTPNSARLQTHAAQLVRDYID